MKMPKDQVKDRVPRQLPVSCRFCRSRKLRCSRVAPCSNCQSRGIPCELDAPTAAAPAVPVKPPASESELLERIRKLEKLVGTESTPQAGDREPRSSSPPTNDQLPNAPNPPSRLQHLNNDVAWLESVYSDRDYSDKIPSNKVIFKTGPIERIHDALTCAHQPTFSSSLSLTPCRVVCFPQRHEAEILLGKYIEDIDYIHHALPHHVFPSVVDEVYSALNRHCQPKLDHVFLLLSIFASATYSWVEEDFPRGLFATQADANGQTLFWMNAAQDVLDIARRYASGSLELLQGVIILAFLIANEEEFSRRSRSFLSLSLSMGREMGLHRLDHPNNADKARSVRAEIGRRLWWYCVASDWSVAARFGGPNEGVYQAHPRQMIVKKPTNIDDEHLCEGIVPIEMPLSHPTAVSYFLQRLRLAEISRTIVDRNPLMVAGSGGISYQDVMDFDTELQRFLNELPPFFSMTKGELVETFQLPPAKVASIVAQGYMIRTMAFSQRCKLHLPYLARGYSDPKYAYSRNICTNSARLLIQNELWQEASGMSKSTRYKSCGLFIGVFMASMVQLVDLCINKGSAQHERHRKEVTAAFRILDESRSFSKIAAKLMDSVMQVLRKHHVAAPKSNERRPLKPESESELLSAHINGQAFGAVGTEQLCNETAWDKLPRTLPGAMELDENQNIAVASGSTDWDVPSSYLAEITSNFEQAAELDGFYWDSLFSELNGSFS